MKHRKVHPGMMFVEQPLLDAIEKEIQRCKFLYSNSTDADLMVHIEDNMKYLTKCLEKFQAKMQARETL